MGMATYLLGLGRRSITNASQEFNDPSNWTLIDEWDTNAGDMVAIDNAFNNIPRGGGLVWNPAGTILTLCSSSDDTIRSFSCSTPFDPETATLIATRAVTNPAHLHMNAAGTILWALVVVGDEISAMPCSGHVIGAGAELSDITKAECGWTGSGDGGFYPTDDLSFMIYDGRVPGSRFRTVTLTPAGDLDSFALGTIFTPTYNVNAGIGGSAISADGTTYYRCVGSPGVEKVTMSTPFDPSTAVVTGPFDIMPPIGFFTDHIWINPLSTAEVWIVGDNSGGLQLARMATNV